MYSSEERETTAVFDYVSNTWSIYTCVPRHMTKLRKIAEPIWEEITGGKVTAAKWNLKGNQVIFANERVSKMSPEKKEAARLRMKERQAKRDLEVTN
ncbi:hypothetical protein D3C74_159640 [compost metagenome]